MARPLFSIIGIVVLFSLCGCDSGAGPAASQPDLKPGTVFIYRYVGLDLSDNEIPKTETTIFDSIAETDLKYFGKDHVMQVFRKQGLPPEPIYYNREANGDLSHRLDFLSNSNAPQWIAFPIASRRKQYF